MKLNPQQRREMFPLDSYDVPINGLIYRLALGLPYASAVYTSARRV